MNRVVSTVMMMALTASLAQAQTSASGNAQGQATGTALPKNPLTGAPTEAQASLIENTSMDATLKNDIQAKAAKTSAKTRARAEAKLDATSKEVDTQADQNESKVADRLSAEFGMTADELMAEKSSSGASWGGLMIAHTLSSNTTTAATAADLLTMHQDGMGWGEIAAGLGLNLGEAVSAVQSEGKVAAGTVKADGKIAIAHGPGAKAGLGLGVKTNTTAQAGGAKIGTSTAASAGVKIKP
jgi:hypothetical protein